MIVIIIAIIVIGLFTCIFLSIKLCRRNRNSKPVESTIVTSTVSPTQKILSSVVSKAADEEELDIVPPPPENIPPPPEEEKPTANLIPMTNNKDMRVTLASFIKEGNC